MERRLIGYVRVGPRERPDARPELEEQRARLRRAARLDGWTLLRVEQDVRSGRSLRRPGLRSAVAGCRAGDAEGVVVSHLHRLTYSLRDLADLVREAVAGGYAIVSLDPPVDLADERGRLVGDVLAEAASWNLRSLAQPARRAFGTRPGRPSSTPPDLATRIRELRSEGMTLQAICDTLNTERVPTPRGGARWRPTSLRAILRAERELG